MPRKYTSEQFWKLYEKLPQELKDALFAEETGNNIYDICKRYGILENLEEIVDYVGQVLVGVTPPDEFQEALEKELKLEKEVAKKVAQEINRYIFYPVKTSLEEIYKIPVAPPPAGLKVTGAPPPTEVTPPSAEEKPEVPPKEDIYREPIE
jgi:hypothetical protein